MKNELEAVITMVEHNGDYFVSSKEVAYKFEKRHDHLLRAIDNINVQDEFCKTGFIPIFEPDSNGINRRVILMNHNAFSLLVFGFTGNNARELKKEFFNEFHKKIDTSVIGPIFKDCKNVACQHRRNKYVYLENNYTSQNSNNLISLMSESAERINAQLDELIRDVATLRRN